MKWFISLGGNRSPLMIDESDGICCRNRFFLLEMTFLLATLSIRVGNK